MTRRARVLMCWGYHRQGWVRPFERLADSVEFQYVFYITPPEHQVLYTKSRILYWGDFKSADALLDETRPDKVGFMGVSSGYPLALNIAARRRGVPTFVLQHGWMLGYDHLRAHHKSSARARTKNTEGQFRALSLGQEGGNRRTLAFMLRSLRGRDCLQLPSLALHVLALRLEGPHFAAKYFPFAGCFPDTYVCHTSANAALYCDLDPSAKERVVVIGNPEFDEFFSSLDVAGPKGGRGEDYFLLLDSPNAENAWGVSLVPVEEKVQFYCRLAKYATSRGAILRVKLHPEDYGRDWLPQQSGIEWIREASLPDLIRNARGCFGFSSTLILPAVAINRVVLFSLRERGGGEHPDLARDLVELGVAKEVPLSGWDEQAISFDGLEPGAGRWDTFVDRYLYKPDGRATERLLEFLVR